MENKVSQKKFPDLEKNRKLQSACAKLFWFKFDSFDCIFACSEESLNMNRKNPNDSASQFHLIKTILIRNTQK